MSHYLSNIICNCFCAVAYKHRQPIGVELSWLENAHSQPLLGVLGNLTSKVGHTDLVLVCDQRSLVGPRMQDYKSLHAVVMICATHCQLLHPCQMHLWCKFG